MTRLFSIAVLVVALASGAWAHGTDKHVMGVVTKITDDAVTVEAADKQVTVVKIAADTSFVKSGAAASLKDLKVGDRVERGQHVGLIKFGSRVDILLPGHAELRVKVGDTVKGGSSVLAYIPGYVEEPKLEELAVETLV